MKMSDRRLKRILRENPVPIQPEKKEEMIAFARICDKNQTSKDLEDGLQMKYIKLKKVRTLIAAAAILSLMAVAVTAGIVNYYYRTPGGNIVDQTGTILEKPENMSLKMTGKELTGVGYTIEEVNWLSYNGQSTFTIWLTADSAVPQNLRAVMDNTEYPLKESFITKDKDGNPLCIGYTALGMPEPQNVTSDSRLNTLWLVCDEPFISTRIYFEPTDIQPVQSSGNGISVTSYIYNGNLYFGAEDTVLEQSPISDMISMRWSSIFPVVTTTDGTVYDGYEDKLFTFSYGVGDGGMVDQFYQIPEGIAIDSVNLPYVYITAALEQKENVTYCDLPIPEIGETLTGEWTLLDLEGMKFTVTKITRDKYSINYYSPDKALRYCYENTYDKTCFAESLGTISIRTGFRNIDDLEEPITSTPGPVPHEGYIWRIASKKMNEYCETHDTIRLSVSAIDLSYLGGWTLTFPEN